MRVLAHRGYAADAAQNTLEAFAAALAMGVDGIETDVRLSADGLPVLFHDRIAPDGRPVAELTRKELSRAAGYDVPTLEESLGEFPSVLWMVEMKAPAAAAQAAAVLARYAASRALMVTSFHHALVRDLCGRLGI